MTINNYRAKEHLQIQFGRRLTILVGENGSGKTTILDAISIGLGAVLTHLPKVSGISFRKTDIRQNDNQIMPFARVKVELENKLVWDRTFRRDKSEKTTAVIPPAKGLVQLKRYLDEHIIHPFIEGKDFQLPVFSYYGVSRALLDVPLRRRGFPKTHQRFESLDNALNAASRFKSAFVWFYNKENEESRMQREQKSFEYRLPELEAVRLAIIKVFPDIKEPHIMVRPLRFAVKMDNEILDIMQLSDGYKTLLSLVIDLASRMALANPGMQNPLEAPAIVLIDEIDLHLHPEWQRKVVGDLLNAFPNAQFILTTHSPYIIESVNNHLQRWHIKELQAGSREIEKILPISPKEVAAWYIDHENEISLMDIEIELLDDKLIHSFNAISELYDKMRDLQWENQLHD